MAEQQHCPGFEANKTLKEVKVKCPACQKEMELFSDEATKAVKCSACGASFEAQKCLVK